MDFAGGSYSREIKCHAHSFILQVRSIVDVGGFKLLFGQCLLLDLSVLGTSKKVLKLNYRQAATAVIHTRRRSPHR